MFYFVLGFFWILSGFSQVMNPHGSWNSAGSKNAISLQSPFCTNGNVNAVEVINGLTYVGGSFTTVGNCAGSLLQLDQSGRLTQNLLSLDRIQGQINSIISDGGSGWYIGGSGLIIDGVFAGGVAHLNADLTLDLTFSGVDRLVNKLALDGSQLFIGGNFENVDGVNYQPGIGSLDAMTGAVNSFNPKLGGIVNELTINGSDLIVAGTFNSVNMHKSFGTTVNTTTSAISTSGSLITGSSINKVISDGAGGWFVSGMFTQIGGVSRKNLAKLNSDLTLDTTFVPPVFHNTYGDSEGQFENIYLQGGRLYVFGQFNFAGSSPRRQIAALDATTGSLLSWNVPIDGGNVISLSGSGTDVYVGGNFSSAGGTFTGGFAKFDSTSSTVDASFPLVNGSINVIEPDGAGGWYIGGAFSSIGSTTVYNLARIKSDNSVDTSFLPNVDGYVNTILMNGTKMYIGGSFTAVNGQTRRNLAEVNLSDGSVTTWNPNSSGEIRTLLLYSGQVYIGGYYSQMGGVERYALSSVDSVTGALSSWDPHVDDYQTVYTMKESGGLLYVGGYFTAIGGVPRKALAAFDLSTGNLTSWAPNVDGGWVGSYVKNMEIVGSTIYFAGCFMTVNGIARYSIGAVDKTTGATTGWAPSVRLVSTWLSSVEFLKISGSRVFIGGDFGVVGGSARYYFADFDITTGNANSFNPSVSGIVNDAEVSGGNTFLGGQFALSGTSRRRALAAFNDSGSLLGWDPNGSRDINNIYAEVISLKFDGTTIYVGGGFQRIGTAVRNNLAAFNTAGVATSWNPNSSSTVLAIEVSATAVYAGGFWSGTTFNGTARESIAKFDKTNGSLTSWNPTINSLTQSIKISGGSIYVSGSFNEIDGNRRYSVASFDESSGALNSLALEFYAGIVSSFAIQGSELYVGGNFQYIGSTIRNNIAAINKTTAVVSSWNPDVNGEISSLLSDSTQLYIGGNFSKIGGTTRNYLGSVLLGNGAVTTFNPNPNDVVKDLFLQGSNIYVAGNFTTISGQSRSYVAQLNSSGTATSWNPSVDAPLTAIAADASTVYISGSFANVNSERREELAALDATTGLNRPWSFHLSSFGSVSQILVTSNKIIISRNGGVGLYNPQPRQNFLVLDEKFNVTNIKIDFNNQIYGLKNVGPHLYAVGEFNEVQGLTRTNFTEINLSDHSVTNWNLVSDGGINEVISDGTDLFIRGYFTVLDGNSRQNLASLSISSKGVNAWNPNPNGQLSKILLNGNDVLVAGTYSNIGGASRAGVASLHKTTGVVGPLSVTFDSPGVTDIDISGGVLYMTGWFRSINGNSRDYVGAINLSDSSINSWHPSGSGDALLAIEIVGGRAIVMGYFSSIGGQAISTLAAVDLTVGNADPNWKPIKNVAYLTPLSSSNGKVYLMGGVQSYGTYYRNLGIADPNTGALAY